MNILFYIIIFCIGIIIGFMVQRLLERRQSYAGIIVVVKEDDRLLYSLEMNDSPENLQFKTKACFKVKISEEESIRK